MVCCTALDGCGDNLSGTFVCLVFGLLLDLFDLDGHFVCAFVLDRGNQIGFGILDAEPGNLFEHFQLASLEGCYFLLLLFNGSNFGIQGIRLLLDGIGLSVESLFLLLKAVFLLFQLGTAFLLLPLIL